MQAKVKEIMYHGLVKLVLADPLAAGAVFDFLLPHFLHFYIEVITEIPLKNTLYSGSPNLSFVRKSCCFLGLFGSSLGKELAF